MKDSKLIVVLGMHRSGTSAVARGLQVMGVELGDRMMPPAENNNITGFWEDVDLNALNIEIMTALGQDWSYLSPIKASNIELLLEKGYFLRAAKLLQQKIGTKSVFGFKDPRVAKLLPFWKEVFRHCQVSVSYVFSIRHPFSVAKSLSRRDGLDAERSYVLWLGHVIGGLIGTTGENCVFVDYDQLMQSPDQELTRIAKGIGLEIDATKLQTYKDEFLVPELRHSVYDLNDLAIDDACPPLVREVYTRLLDVATDKSRIDEVNVQNSLVTWVNEFDRVTPILALTDRLFTEKELAAELAAENNNRIVGLNQEVTDLKHGVVERDGQISSLSQYIAERDEQIINLNQNVAERDEQIISLNQNIAECDEKTSNLNQIVLAQENTHREILNSISWRLTAPLRTLGTISSGLLSAPKLVASAIKQGGGFKSTFSSTINLLKKDGVAGVREALATVRTPVSIRENNAIEPIDEVDVCDPVIPRIEFDKTRDRFVERHENPPVDSLVKLIAFYLPQFHPIPENDEWWGKGFTEWTNVGKARPNYVGHYQPHCPIHFGYYDLRVPAVMEEQAKLAREYGIYGFSYYFYWFNGEILLDTPLEMMLENKNVDIAFCLTWANENWSRRWDGQENDILMNQSHSHDDSLSFIRHLIKYFEDERYICVEGKPVLIIYRADIIPNMAATAKIWREELVEHGIPGIYLVSAQSFGITSPEVFDFDASVEFPPHTIKSEEIGNKVKLINAEYEGLIYSYEQVVANAVTSKEPDYKLFRTAMLSWDNTARKQNNGHIFHGFSLLRYKQWLSSIVNKVYSNQKYTADEKIVFVNAWNEWAEGTHLEPDSRYGYGYLQSTYDVIKNYDASDLAKLNCKQGSSKKNKYAVILHLHYKDLWPVISDYLTRSISDLDFDLYVSVTSSSVAKNVIRDFPEAYIELVENRGRDILPFIRMLKVIKSQGYTAVCKLHSKRSIYRDDGDDIRDEMFESLMGSKEQVNSILSRFNDNGQLGIVAPKDYLIQHNDHNMTFDKEVVRRISKHLHVDFRYDTFPAGSMFWFAPKCLDPLLTMDHTFFEIESGLADGTTAHAVERMFCLVAKNKGWDVESC